MHYKPVLSNILLQEISEKKSIIIDEPIMRAEVISIGSGTPTEPMQVRPQQIVHVSRTDLRKLEFREGDFYLTDQSNILVIEED